MHLDERPGPLQGLTVVELAGLGPVPHACMILADLGADVVRIERPGSVPRPAEAVLHRGRPSVALDLKHPQGVATVLRLVARADLLVEGMRPGVAERLGVGPDECLTANPRLVYGRMTGWGQDGPWAQRAGHDLTYIAVAGALHGSGQDPSRPGFASNLVGDFGGGSTYLVIGLLAALFEARISGRGQVVDAAVVDGTAHLNALATGFLASGEFVEQRASNLLDGGVPWYDVYETADAKHMAVAALEPQFYAILLDRLGIADVAPDRDDAAHHEELRDLFARTFRQRTQAEWDRIFAGTDACVAPVLSLSEAALHPHLRARETYQRRDGVLQPAPAPRFSRTPTTIGSPPAAPGTQTRSTLTAWGIDDVDDLLACGAAYDG